ncbi:MAG: galactokinase [Bacteroidetes bacterium]|nr:galactokinase [Bacteroidota bacterium]
MSLISKVKASFSEHFRGTPIIVQSPGRINLIGEHTDYNDGFVLPAAIDKYVVAAMAVNKTATVCRIYAIDKAANLEYDVMDDFRYPMGSWESFVIGVMQEVQHAGYAIGGFDMTFAGNIPQGAGLSSSAALENAIVFGLDELFDLGIAKDEMIRIAQKAEHNYVGVQCGIMDQFASMMGKAEHAIFLDCRSMESVPLPLELGNYEFLLINSNVEHELVESEYNLRKEECETGLAIMQDYFPDIKALRDVSPAQLEAVSEHLPPVIYDRCKYVIRENLRVMNCVIALRGGAIDKFGKLLFSAHDEMRYLYEITCPEVDFLVDEARDHENVMGSRMMGGGFGGCTLNIIEKGTSEDVKSQIGPAYEKLFGRHPDFISVEITNGTSIQQ